jgi:hypothetical protein
MWQVRERHKDGGKTSVAEKQATGKLYVQCLLNDLALGTVDEWITKVEAPGEKADAVLEKGLGDLLRQLVAKVKAGDRWQLPEGRYGSEEEKRLGRPIVVSHVKELQMALTRAVDERRDSGAGSRTRHVERGYFQGLGSFGEAKTLLSQRRFDAQTEACTEADQPAEIGLYYEEKVQEPSASAHHPAARSHPFARPPTLIAATLLAGRAFRSYPLMPCR